jgi:Fic family protein
MISVSKSILDRRAAYYDALKDAQGPEFVEQVDVTPFIQFHTDALLTSAAVLEERVISFNKRRDAFVRQTDGVLNNRQVTALMFMDDIGPLSSSVYARLTNCSASSAQADLAGLLREEWIVREGAGRNTRYRIHPKLAAAAEAISSGAGRTPEPPSVRAEVSP